MGAAQITIVTPALNAVGFIGECLRTVANQPVAVDHIVVDGESDDGTVAAIESTGIPVRVLQQPALGIYTAINAGIQAARGEIIGILHADDFYASGHVLDEVVRVLGESGAGACFGDLCYVDRFDPTRVVRYWRAGEFRPGRFRHGWMPPHPTFFVRRHLLEQHGLYRTDLGTAADYELMLRLLLRHAIAVRYIPEVLVHMRSGGASNASWRARLAANRMDRRAWQVNGLRPYPWTLVVKPLRKVSQWWRRPL